MNIPEHSSSERRKELTPINANGFVKQIKPLTKIHAYVLGSCCVFCSNISEIIKYQII